MKWQSNIWLIWKDLLKFSTLCLSLFLTEFLQCKKIWLDISYDFLFSADFFFCLIWNTVEPLRLVGPFFKIIFHSFAIWWKIWAEKLWVGAEILVLPTEIPCYLQYFGFQRKGGNKEVNMLKNSSTQGVLKIFPFLVCYTKNSSYRNNF